MKPLILAILLFTLFPVQEDALKERTKTFRNHKRFFVKYDKFKDQTMIGAGPFVVGGDMRYALTGKQMYITAGFVHPGATVNRPVTTFILYVRATGKDWQFLKARELYALADGERFEFGEGIYDGEVRRGFTGVGLSESLGFAVPAEAFQKLGTAEKVELKIGNFEMKLKDEHKEAFRDLLSLAR